MIEIDGTNVENELHEKVVEKLNNAGARINLVVGCPARNSRPPYLNAFRHVRIVQIEKPVNGLGFNIVGGEVDHQGTVISGIYLFIYHDVHITTWALDSSPSPSGPLLI